MIAKIIIGIFIICIIACVAKKNFVGALITLGFGLVIVALWNDPNSWDVGGNSIKNTIFSGIDALGNGFKSGL